MAVRDLADTVVDSRVAIDRNVQRETNSSRLTTSRDRFKHLFPAPRQEAVGGMESDRRLGTAPRIPSTISTRSSRSVGSPPEMPTCRKREKSRSCRISRSSTAVISPVAGVFQTSHMTHRELQLSVIGRFRTVGRAVRPRHRAGFLTYSMAYGRLLMVMAFRGQAYGQRRLTLSIGTAGGFKRKRDCCHADVASRRLSEDTSVKSIAVPTATGTGDLASCRPIAPRHRAHCHNKCR